MRSRPPALAAAAPSEGEALDRSRGGFSTKVHVWAEGCGKPVTFHLTGGERLDSTGLRRSAQKSNFNVLTSAAPVHDEGGQGSELGLTAVFSLREV
jgi:hypothetical protein